jgi:hypothetical protein
MTLKTQGASPEAPRTRETGIRLYVDQIEKLDLIVRLHRGRKDRSTLIREAIDAFTDSRLGQFQT